MKHHHHPLFLILMMLAIAGGLRAQGITEETVRDTIHLNFRSDLNADTTACNLKLKRTNNRNVALVLSGGGARGLSQIGVMRQLEIAGIKPDLIVGTSMGSIIGGLYSSGYSLKELKTIFRKFDWTRALSLSNKYLRTTLFPDQKRIQDRSLVTIPLDGITPVIIPAALSNGLFLSEKINSLVLNSRYHAGRKFDELKFPFAAVATDLNSGKREVLTEGDLSQAIKASLTFPLLYSPISLNGKYLVDGGLTANIPAEVARTLGADYIIAVNTTSPLRKAEELDDPIATADQILSITMSQLNELQLKEANTVITPELGDHSLTDFSDFENLFERGETAASLLISRIKADLDSIELSASPYRNNFITNATLRLSFEGKLTDTLFRISDLMPGEFEKYTSIESNLKKLYATGYFSDVKAVVERDQMSATVDYVLTPNPPFIGFTRSGIMPPQVSRLLEEYEASNSGKTINLVSISVLKDDLLGALREKGISYAGIKKLCLNHSTGKIEIELTNGVIDSVVITGNRNTSDNVIDREIEVESNSAVTKNQLDKTMQNIISTNLFEQVSVNITPDAPTGRNVLRVSVSEKNTKALRLSIRADNVFNFQAFADLRDENVFGSAVEAGLLVGGGLRNRVYRAEIKSNQIFSLPFTFNFSGFYQFRDIYRYLQINNDENQSFDVLKTGEYRNIAGGFSLLAGTQLERLGTIYGQVFVENLKVNVKSGNPGIAEDNNIVKLRFGGIFDTQDKWPFPDNGILLNFDYETAKNINDGNLSYTKLNLNYEQYLPIHSQHVLRPRLLFGFGDNTTPLSDQFSIGGQELFYGMVDDELRGRQILLASLEYRFEFPYRIFFDTYIGARYDLGNVWNIAQDIRFKDLRQGIGAFISFDTPIGEGSLAAGRSFFTKSGLQEDSFYFGPYVFYFSIGYEF
ncbi:MAG: patatin-like phospholipase family protein [Ignavibacteria bacterium]|nr:patatin-like phospholipase family protein [Ignavibacteria bacterium]